MVTTETISGYEIQEYLGYISETVTFGINGVVEFFQIADTFGGESSIYKNTFDEAKDILNKRLETRAKEMGGNAVIGLRINYNEIIGKGRSSILVSGTGTVVKAEITEEHKKRMQEIFILQEKAKEKKLEEYKNYIYKLTVDELIKEFEKISDKDKKILKDIILEREDIKSGTKEFDNYDIDILEAMQEYNNNAELTLILRKIK